MRPDPTATLEHWNRLAAGYDAAKTRNSAYFDGLKRLFDDAVPADQRGRVLDVGCGTGQILAHLHPAEGVGIDASPEMIAAARARFPDHGEMRFEVHDAAAAGELGVFDTVVSGDLLEHVPDFAAVLDAMVEACRPGGLIVVSTPNPTWTLPLWLLEKTRLKMPEGPHEFVSRRDIARRLVERGCRIERRGTHALVPARLGGIGPRLSALAERIPVASSLGVIQLVVARRPARRKEDA